MMNDTSIDPVPESAPGAPPKKTKKYWLIGGLVVLVAVVAVAGWWFWRSDEQSMAPSDNSGVTSSGGAENRSDSTIAAICAAEKQSTDGTVTSGSVALDFKPENTSADIRRYFERHDYKINAGELLLDQPTPVNVYWSDAFFTNLVPITVAEVNDFLGRLAADPNVKVVNIGSGWQDSSVPERNAGQVQRIDRFGYFTVTLADQAVKGPFFIQYPEATFFGDGRIVAGSLTVNPAVTQVTVLYRAQVVLSILNKLKEEGKLVSGTVPADRRPPGASLEQHAIVLREYPNSTGNATRLAINFKPEISGADIRTALAQYPAIDAEKSGIQPRLNRFVIAVPVGEEACWARELAQHPEIESAFVN